MLHRVVVGNLQFRQFAKTAKKATATKKTAASKPAVSKAAKPSSITTTQGVSKSVQGDDKFMEVQRFQDLLQMKVNLPTRGPIWFHWDPQVSPKDIQDNLMEEDRTIT